MSLNFGAASSSVIFSVGNAANASNGAVTLIALWKPNFGSTTNTGLVAAQVGSSGIRRAFLVDTSALFGDGDFTSGVAISGTAGDWLWVAMSKPAGSAHYRMHWRNFTTGGAWTHGEAAGAGNHTDPGVANQLNVGASAETASANGDVAVSAIFTSELTDGAIQTACTAALADLMAASPAWAVRFMNSAPSSIQDLTGGGGNETSRPGTVTNTADPSGFDFSLTGGITALGRTPIQRHPGRGPSAAQFYRDRRSTELSAAQASSGSGVASARTETAGAGVKKATGGATASARTSTTSSGVKGAAGAALPTARTTTTDSGVKKATGAGAPTARTSATDTGVKQATGAGLPTARTSVTDTGVKKATGTGLPSARTATAATSGAPAPTGSGTASARTSTTSSGVKGAAGAALPSARTSVTDAGVKKAAGAGLPSARTSTTQAGLKKGAGLGLPSARTSTLDAGVKKATGTGRPSARTATASAGGAPVSNPSWSYVMEQSPIGWDAAPDITWTIEQGLPVWRISQA